MYKPVKVHVPEKVHEKLKSLIVKDKVMPIKINLQDGDDILLLTLLYQDKRCKNRRKTINNFTL